MKVPPFIVASSIRPAPDMFIPVEVTANVPSAVIDMLAAAAFVSTVVIANAVCTATASALPSSGTEDFTITITDSINGDYATAKLTLGTP